MTSATNPTHFNNSSPTLKSRFLSIWQRINRQLEVMTYL